MVPFPLYRDPVYDGAADPMIIRKESDGKFYMFYTQRRANQQVEGVSFAYGTKIGVAESEDGSYWYYRGALDLDFEFGHNTYWAPEIVYEPETTTYHMYVSYIRGIHITWKGKATIEHYTSKDLFYWTRVGSLEFGSSRIIDPAIFRLPNGIWRMWYKDENQNSATCYADSCDLHNWEYRGIAAGDSRQEGPNVFEFYGKYWLISDVWDGLAVYSSNDLEHFTRQDGNILRSDPRTPDVGHGAHADVFTHQGRAFIVYFNHPHQFTNHTISVVYLAELKLEDGKLTCDPNAPLDVDWTK
ncbi:MAG: glycosyl hydrolase [Ruminococcaceae bacterium]|nr:glycosyl hydrolase [Oscillospiraceae bacterium]